jgi:hypothetical protein
MKITMKITMKDTMHLLSKLMIVLVFSWSIIACNSNQTQEDTNTSEDSQNTVSGLAQEDKEDKKEDKETQIATISFEETNYDFGNANEGMVIKHSFKFTNNGKVPLVIKSAQGSCGCTVADYPKEPIAPGASASINAEFNSDGRSGKANKTVTIKANTEPAETVLTITGMVKAKANGPVKQ